jgi:hypothetical protein
MGRDRLGWAGESDNDYAGDGVAGVGDVDGDGLDDVLIAASAAHMEAVNGGAVYLLYGAFE